MTDGENVVRRCDELGIALPTAFTFLPVNLMVAESVAELAFSKFTPDLERALTDSGSPAESALPNGSRYYVEQRGADWVLPLMLFGADVGSASVQVALSILGNYLYDRMKRQKVSERVKMSLVHHAGGAYQRLDYDGPVEGLKLLGNWTKEGTNGCRSEVD